MEKQDRRLIEAGFPCHQVGAETQRERGASSALPPLYFLHVWWARRPLTPSRAAILASLEPAGSDPDHFLRRLGIERVVTFINGVQWVLFGDALEAVKKDSNGREHLPVTDKVLRLLANEQERRTQSRILISALKNGDQQFGNHQIIAQWEKDSILIPQPMPRLGYELEINRIAGNPALVKDRIFFAGLSEVKRILGKEIRWSPEDSYGCSRAFTNTIEPMKSDLVVLDPTAGGGSIPFEALRLGYKVISNDLNPVATIIQYATLDYPARFGKALMPEIKKWGQKLLGHVEKNMAGLAPFSPLPESEKIRLKNHLSNCPEILKDFDIPEFDHTGQIFVRQVFCPHCRGETPLLNTHWLSKEDDDKWGVRVITDKKDRNGTVKFETYRVVNNRGPNGEDPEVSTVSDGVGTCVHCKQGIPGDEIKAQARGDADRLKWKDRLYCVVAVRHQPKLGKEGKPERFKTGDRKGQIKTEKIRFFRPPNQRDLDALVAAEKKLAEKWPEWEKAGLIPTEAFPQGNDMRPVTYGMPRWCDLFTPRQLLGHLTLIDGLNKLKPQIITELGRAKAQAVVTYLQFAIDKGLDYNSRQTRWEFTRGVVKGTFGRHDFSLKWTFGEMIFTGPNSGAMWGLSQVLDSYEGIAGLLNHTGVGREPNLRILHGSAAHLNGVQNKSVDLVCMDPPYYDNVQYAELSDYFYIWQKRTLSDLYPDVFSRRLTDKREEAVANPAVEGSRDAAKKAYECRMAEIFKECNRVLKDNGLLTVMFTHKTQEAWETLTRSLIESGWIITSSFPVDSESSASLHQKDLAAAASSIFITCRKRPAQEGPKAVWSGFGGTGVQVQIREAVREGLKEFAQLKLNPVDEMVASYGRALQILSEHWPVMDGDDAVGPMRAMNEASRVVAENQIGKITGNSLTTGDLDSETAMSLIIFGIYGHGEFAFDEALSLSKSLNISLTQKSGGYRVEDRVLGLNVASTKAQYFAPVVKRASKLRLVLPEERSTERLQNPQTSWDILHGTLLAYREGDVPVARAYIQKNASTNERKIIDLIKVWAAEADSPELHREARSLLFSLGEKICNRSVGIL